jgi:hypothetical protein
MKSPTRQPHESEWIYSTTLSQRLFTPLSEYVHDLPSPSSPAVELCIAACGYAFNPVMFPCWPILVYASSSSSNAWKGGGRRPALNDAGLYLASALITLAFTEVGKASLATTRPPPPPSGDRDDGADAYRRREERRYGGLVGSLKSKHSFPSGDCAQAMNLCMMLWTYVPPLPRDDDGDGGMLCYRRDAILFGMFLPGVAFARVYYRCHWIEDCLGGMLLSWVLHRTIIPFIARRIMTGSAHWFE